MTTRSNFEERGPLSWLARALRDWLLVRRDRLLTSVDFQRWASRFPLTRTIARREALAAFDLCAGFVYTQVLRACIDLDVLDQVRSGPMAESQLMVRIGLPAERARLLVNAAVSLGLLSRRAHDRIGLGMRGAAIVSNPSIADMVRHHALLYQDLADPVRLLKASAPNTELGRFWPYRMDSEPYAAPHESVAGYSQLMTGSLPMIAEEILDAYPFQNHRSVMDVGGGEGAFVAALARRRPGLQLHLIDLPDVAARAHQRFRGSGLADRIATHGIDFLTQPLPSGSDAITLVRIVHDHDDAAVATLLRAVWRALAPGGSLIIAEPMSHTRGAERVADAYFALYLLAMGSGRPRSPNELRELIAAAGFVEVRLVETRLPMLVRLLVALKPSRHEWM